MRFSDVLGLVHFGSKDADASSGGAIAMEGKN